MTWRRCRASRLLRVRCAAGRDRRAVLLPGARARGARSAFRRAGAVVAAPVGFRRAAGAARRALVGMHDFTAFTPTETEHVRFSRDVFAAYWRRGPGSDVLEFWIEADAFMRHMNRVLVGTMLEVGSGGGRWHFVALLRGGRGPRPADRAGAWAVPGRRGVRRRASIDSSAWQRAPATKSRRRVTRGVAASSHVSCNERGACHGVGDRRLAALYSAMAADPRSKTPESPPPRAASGT